MSVVSRYCNTSWLPNIPKASKCLYISSDNVQMQLLTVGMFAYIPNLSGVDWFVSSIWPIIHNKYPQMVYGIVGKGIPKSYDMRWRSVPGVRIFGFVPKIEQMYANSKAVVVPLLTGGGTSVKTIEALAYGKKVFSTSIGARGFSNDEIVDAGISLFSGAADLLQSLDYYLGLSADSHKKLCDAAKNFVKNNYSEECFSVEVQSRFRQ